MKIATQFKWGAATLVLALVPCAYGQVMPANTAEAKKAAAQLSEAAGPTLATQDQLTDRTTVPGAATNSSGDTDNKPRQSLYEDSAAAAGGARDTSMNGMQPDRGASSTAANGQRGEIGVWLTENGGRGVRVGRIARDGAADRAGIKNGDIILQVNGNGVASPSATAQQIRQVQVGQTAMLTVLRDGEQKQLQVTLMAARPGQQYTAGYGGDEGSNRSERSAMETDSSGLAARTSRLEQQVESMTEELRQMRQQMSSMRASGAEAGPGTGTAPSAVSPPSSSVTPPQSGSGSTAPSSSATPISTPTSSSSPAAGGPSTPSTPPAVGGSGSTSGSTDDLFGTPSSSSGSPTGGTSK